LVSWLGTSLLEHVTLDYYVMSTSCENSGIQVALLKGQSYQQALALNQASPNPLPGPWKPSAPPKQDVVDVYGLLRTRSVADTLTATATASQASVVHVFDAIQ
jgi:hypothetical protein